MLLVSGKEILKEINLKLDETILELGDNMTEMLSEKDVLLGSYEEKLTHQKEQIEKLQSELTKREERCQSVIAQLGGLSRGNKKLSNDKLILQERVRKLNELLSERDKTIASLQNEKIDIEKMQSVIAALEKTIQGKMRELPTKEKIINYDRKNPIMKK